MLKTPDAARSLLLRPWVLLLAVALVARVRTFGNPIIFSDEEFYLLVARAMWHGALPYVDIWDRKPIGLFLLYLPAAPFAPQTSVYVYQALALAAVVATAVLIAVTARRAGWSRGALVAGALYLLMLDLADGQGGQSTVFYNLPMIAAVAVTVMKPGGRRRAGMVAMALVGVALQIKYSVVFEGIWIGLWLMKEEWRATRSIGRAIGFGAALAAIALVPTVTALLCYVMMGHGEAFIFANFISIFLRRADPMWMQVDNATVALELLGPLVLMSLGGMGATNDDGRGKSARLFLFGWFVVAMAGFVAFGSWYNHYTLAVMLPGCLCAAAFLGGRRSGRLLALPVLALAFVAGQVVLSSELRNRGTPAQFAALVRAVGPGPGSLYGDMGHPALHMFTGRPALSPWFFPSHLQIDREAGAIGVDQAAEIDRIFARHPDVVTIEGPDNGAAPARIAQVRSLATRGDYGPPTRLPLGNEWVDIYHRRSTSTDRPASPHQL